MTTATQTKTNIISDAIELHIKHQEQLFNTFCMTQRNCKGCPKNRQCAAAQCDS